MITEGRSSIQIGRVNQPEDVAKVILFCAPIVTIRNNEDVLL